jgi:hypothetical protein
MDHSVGEAWRPVVGHPGYEVSSAQNLEARPVGQILGGAFLYG